MRISPCLALAEKNDRFGRPEGTGKFQIRCTGAAPDGESLQGGGAGGMGKGLVKLECPEEFSSFLPQDVWRMCPERERV